MIHGSGFTADGGGDGNEQQKARRERRAANF
jgi:hypothetical protein